MIAVISEVWPKHERKQDYLDIAAELRPLLEKIDGFISIERFESLYEPGKILSLSFFRNEAAVEAWRRTNEHRLAQAKGRGEIFADYRLRVAGVIRDYGKNERAQVPGDSREAHDSERRLADDAKNALRACRTVAALHPDCTTHVSMEGA
jgi:heme-degrading monooxygenase HmoA